ncbi:MAG: hypothetical protein ACE5GH_07225, partial [Fidelibacterota bacterium]
LKGNLFFQICGLDNGVNFTPPKEANDNEIPGSNPNPLTKWNNEHLWVFTSQHYANLKESRRISDI